MKHLTKDNLLQKAGLQVKICAIEERLVYIKNLMQQLSTDKCKVTFAFYMHNEDQHKINVAQKELEKADTVITVMGPMSLTEPKQLPSCSISFQDNISESLAMRMLNLMYIEECNHQLAARLELSNLIGYTDHHTENPILSLHLNNEHA